MTGSSRKISNSLRYYAGRPILNSGRLFPDIRIDWRPEIGEVPSPVAVQSTWADFQREIAQQVFSAGSLKPDFLRVDILKLTVSGPQYRMGQKIIEKLKADDMGRKLLLMITDSPLGNPYLLPRYPLLSPVGAQNIYYLVLLKNLLSENVLEYKGNFVDFGGGYGYFSRAVVTINDTPQVHIIDLPIMSVIQRAFHEATLSADRYSRISYHNSLALQNDPEALQEANSWLSEPFHFNATFSLSECDRDTQMFMLKNIVSRSKSFLIIYASEYHGVDNQKIYNCDIQDLCKDHAISHHVWGEYTHGNIVIGTRRQA